MCRTFRLHLIHFRLIWCGWCGSDKSWNRFYCAITVVVYMENMNVVLYAIITSTYHWSWPHWFLPLHLVLVWWWVECLKDTLSLPSLVLVVWLNFSLSTVPWSSLMHINLSQIFISVGAIYFCIHLPSIADCRIELGLAHKCTHIVIRRMIIVSRRVTSNSYL